MRYNYCTLSLCDCMIVDAAKHLLTHTNNNHVMHPLSRSAGTSAIYSQCHSMLLGQKEARLDAALAAGLATSSLFAAGWS